MLGFDSRGTASADGLWDFFPGAHVGDDLDGRKDELIRVPGLWQAQG